MAKSGADGRWWIRERASALRSAHRKAHKLKNTPRSTQVRGPREEVTPLLLPISLYISEVSQVQSAPRAVCLNNGEELKDEDETKGGNESQCIVPHAGGGEALFIG